MKKTLFLILCLAGFILSPTFFVARGEPSPTPPPLAGPTPTPTTAPATSELQQKIRDLETKVVELRGQAKTLFSQIAVMDNQVRLTQLRIERTREELKRLEEDIDLLEGKISNLEENLDDVSKVLIGRIVATYQVGKVPSWQLFVSTTSFSDYLHRLYYLRVAQEHDKKLIFAIQATKANFESQKNIFEKKQEQAEVLKMQLEKQTVELARQKKDKEVLLEVTRNDERRYQELLARARAEFAVSLGQGQETFLREVSEADVIGRIIPTSSGCSSGQHLHFEVHKENNVEDPSNYLKPTSFQYARDYNESYYGSIAPHGSWNWPLTEPITVNQGFGSHGFAQAFYPEGRHNGIDIDSDSSTVKAVKKGKLYAGSYQCGGRYPGTLLYAKVDHGDGITAWYLHITPQ